MSNFSPLPQNIEAEQRVLGAILIEGRAIEQVFPILTPEDFYDPRNLVLFNHFLKMYNQGLPIDIATVHHELKSLGMLEKMGDFSYLSYLTEIVTSSANIVYWANIVRETAKERRFCETLRDLNYKLSNGSIKFHEASEQIRARIESETLTNDSRLKPVSAIELDNIEPVKSLWGEIIFPECITQINSEPGVGKSTLFYNLCAYGAKGEGFLGVPFSKRVKSLYIDLETPKWKRKEKLNAICETELPVKLYFLDQLDLRKDIVDLLNLSKKEKYDLVIFDTQSRVFSMEKENDNSEAIYLMGLLRRFVNEVSCAVILIHHTGKSDDSKGVYRGRGASAIAAGVDIVINLEALNEEVIKMTIAKNRVVGTNPVLYLRKAGEERFEPYTPLDASSGFEILDAQSFLNSFPNSKEWKTEEIYRLGKEKGFSQSTMKRALSRLVEAVIWERIKKGIYRKKVTGHGSKSSDIYPDPIDP
jgi:hypothetical protein